MTTKTLFDVAKEYEARGLLRASRMGDFTLFCYTQDTFYGENTWDNITMNHRGRLYYKGVPVNSPMPKIFNLDEVNMTSFELISEMMSNVPYEVYDKANGHLFMVSTFVDDEGEIQMMFHTKGSLPDQENKLLEKDIELFLSNHGNALAAIVQQFPVGTYMFEAIVEHDPHTLYESQCETYGIEKNGFILLDAALMFQLTEDSELEWVNCDYPTMCRLAEMLGTKVVHRYEVSDIPGKSIRDWLEHVGIEGYVIRFANGHSVKIKTKDYWRLRFNKDLTARRIIQMFNAAGFDRIHLKLPEEMAEKIQVVLTEFFDNWYINDYVKASELTAYIEGDLTDKEIAQHNELKTHQKSYIFAVRSGKTYDLTRSVVTRTEFVKCIVANEQLMAQLQKNIESIVA